MSEEKSEAPFRLLIFGGSSIDLNRGYPYGGWARHVSDAVATRIGGPVDLRCVTAFPTPTMAGHIGKVLDGFPADAVVLAVLPDACILPRLSVTLDRLLRGRSVSR